MPHIHVHLHTGDARQAQSRRTRDTWSDAARKAAAAARAAKARGGSYPELHQKASAAHAMASTEHQKMAQTHSSGQHRIAHSAAAQAHQLASYEHGAVHRAGGREDPFHKGEAAKLSNRAIKASNSIPKGDSAISRDAGTSEGARKAAQTRKAHTNSSLSSVGITPHATRTTHYPEGGGHHTESASGYAHETRARLEKQGFTHVSHEPGVSVKVGAGPGRVTGGGFTARYKHPSGVTATHEVSSSRASTGRVTYRVPAKK